MTTFERVKKLCKDRGISLSRLEENVGFGKNSIYSWKQNNPSSDKLKKVADYFNVSVDYLLGRTEKENFEPELTAKDERDIQKELQKIIEGLEGKNGYAAFDGQTLDDMDDEDRELLIASLENSLRLAKRISKQKFTPKKYRK
ncbi:MULTISPECIES: helix-turn-helix domain-containing protein [Bacillus]|mgnify:CR=1 FL=1|uniref:helix-turn-helix domain-containing protein n=2 Tax=Bacillaceae TaxID=186817 RepID=UPI00034D8F9C|nr:MULTISPECIES: helix-turn-helix transcriptional regulator [Bacillus]KKB93964.1 Cro/Cl family transcriptional regulator [Bacillus sp. CMAA 1185]MBC9023231.1 helix-turn-helix transcriptional regulator [Bacillus subtilis]MCA0105688.1 helix-turn-helix domain-containing protein [Bacillus subtilis]MCH4867008.1 helix-turn-helix domain-containing protein [Bacillus sp. 1006-3]MCJ2152891.1 helix-turn-helix domain-containing protein [Bacillus subtilis]